MTKRKFIPKVSEEIKTYFHSSGMNMNDAAKVLGITSAAVSQQLRLPFGKNSSIKWAKAFAFNRTFLLTGEGQLFGEDKNPEAYDKKGNQIKKGDKVIFSDTEGHLHCRHVTDIICKYVNNWDYGLTDVKYSRELIDGKDPDETLLYFDMGGYATPVIVNSKNTFKQN